MKDNYNELVNNYIDKELNQNELETVKELIQTNDKFKTLLTVQNYVHETLAEIPPKFAPAGFTDLIMEKLMHKISEKYKRNYLFRGVISALLIILIFTLFFFFYYLGDLAFVKNAAESAGNYTNIISSAFSYLSHIMNTEIFRTVSVLLGFIILIGFYFTYNSHKSLRNILDKL